MSIVRDNRAMDGNAEAVDRVSNLPDFILHHIMSYLRRKDAVRTSVLSKRWNCIWDSFPILEFDQEDQILAELDCTPEYMNKTREFMTNVVDKSLQRFFHRNLKIQSFDLSLPVADPKLISLVDRWLELLLDYGVPEIFLSVSTYPDPDTAECNNYYSLPQKVFDHVRSIKTSSRFYSLQKLVLTSVCITENIIQDIIRNCPNITCFTLWNFYGLKTVQISNLDKLVSVRLGILSHGDQVERVDIDAPNLQKFRFISYVPNLACGISLTSCHDLKELALSNCSITDDIFHLYLSRFPLLEDLNISNCHMLRQIKIYAQRLKRLLFRGCKAIEVFEIDSPILSSFEYSSSTLPVLLSKNVPCQMIIESILCIYDKFDTSWFLKLRKNLGFSCQRKNFSLIFGKNNEVCFDIEELGDAPIPPLIEVDNLKICCSSIIESLDSERLINGLLWSCHPRTISFSSDNFSKHQHICIKLLCETLLGTQSPMCCNSTRIKCWRHDLKGARIKIVGGIEDDWLLHWNYLVDPLPPLAKDQEVQFLLEWDYY